MNRKEIDIFIFLSYQLTVFLGAENLFWNINLLVDGLAWRDWETDHAFFIQETKKWRRGTMYCAAWGLSGEASSPPLMRF